MIAHRCQHIVPRRALIIKPSALGDVVTAMPVLRGLKRTFGDVHTSWLLSDACAPLVAHDSDLDEVILFERRRLGRAWRSLSAAMALRRLLRHLRTARFDWVIDLQGLVRSGLLTLATRAPLRAGFADAREGAWACYSHRLKLHETHTIEKNLALAQGLGIDARQEDFTLQVSRDAQVFVERLSAEHALRRGQFLVCIPPTRWPSKRYPPRHWRTVIRALRDEIPVVLLGAPGDERQCNDIIVGLGDGVVNLAGRTSVPEMVGVIAASGGALCSDSAAKFIAPAVGVDVVTLIGPTQAERTGPYRHGRALVAQVPCQGCLRKRCAPAICMELIPPADVIATAREMLSRRRT